MSFLFFFIWLRGVLPRMRYDTFMQFGWKVLIPVGLVWILLVAGIRQATTEVEDRGTLLVGVGIVFAVVLAVLWLLPAPKAEGELDRDRRHAHRTGHRPHPAVRGRVPDPTGRPGRPADAALAAQRRAGDEHLRPVLRCGHLDDHRQGGLTMAGFLDPVRGFGLTFTTMFKKVTTEQYPEQVTPTAPRYHGRHVLNRHPDGLEKCIGCELCAWACPADAIYVEGADNTEEARYSPGERYAAVYQINYLRCIFCGLCIEACPTRSLTMTNEYELADDSRQDLIFTKTQLMAPLLPGMEQPPHPMRLGDHRHRLLRRCHLERRRLPARRLGGGVMEPELLLAATSTGEAITFWVLGPLSLVAALMMVLSRNTVHAALFLAAVMLSLAGLYAAQDAPFLAAAQVIVYTGAVLMLFLFVLMLVGVDASDSLVETLRGHRIATVVVGIGFAGLLVATIGGAVVGDDGTVAAVGLDAANEEGNVVGIARVLFTDYLFAFEITAALLITAALGATVLTHNERTEPKTSQRERARQRFAGRTLTALPGPGVYAGHNSTATPALLPDGSEEPSSVSSVLETTPGGETNETVREL